MLTTYFLLLIYYSILEYYNKFKPQAFEKT